MKYIYHLRDAFAFGWPGLEGQSYSEATDFDRASAARFKVTDHHGRVYNEISDRIYLVLEGSGHFTVAGQRFKVTKTDVIIVPRMTEYDYGGNMELFLVHCPAYDVTKDHDLDNLQGLQET
jgi:mannose-6-phosphate isomerase-like protein (cupin superfamily)